MKTNQQTYKPRILSMSTLISVAAVILLGSSPNALGQWTTNGNNIYNTNSGNVGIGTTSPVSLLHLGGAAAITFDTPGTNKFRFQTLPGIPNWGALTLNANYIYPIGWYLDDTSTNGWFFKLDNRGANGPSDSNGLWLWRVPPGSNPRTAEIPVFGVTTGQAYFEGNVGIGTMTPSAKLDVNGSINVSGNINAKFQDVAEWVTSSEKLPTGTVVVLDSNKSNQVIASTVGYDTRVAGVISEQPGIALGEKGESKVLVATTGRVRVKVNATRTPIHIGDLLVTSDVPGVAMKSKPVNLGGVQIQRPGTLIGKALEPLEKGSGTILVLLSLQ